MSKLPLEGVRVLEASHALAMPHAMDILGDMGAEVILVEHTGQPYRSRGGGNGPFPDNEPGEDYWNRSGTFNHWNRNKLSLTLDLSDPRARGIFKALVRVSDVVSENFTARVMKNFGLSYPELKKVRKDIIMVSNTGYGHFGPWENYVAMAQVIEAALSAHLTGWPDRAPSKAGQSVYDMMCSFNIAAAVLMALHYRRRTGKGQFIDHSMFQACVPSLGGALMDVAMNQRDGFRMGNRHPLLAPQGCYRCRGDDDWVVISVASDAEWRALCHTIGDPDVGNDPRFRDAVSRRNHQDELDGIIAGWTASRDKFEIMDLLQKAGVASGVALSNKELLLNPHYKARQYFEMREHHPDTGVGTRPYAGRPYRLSEGRVRSRRIVAPLGYDNERLLGDLLGMSPAELRALEEERVIGRHIWEMVREGGDKVYEKATSRNALPLEVQKERGVIQDYDPDYKEVLGL